MTIKAGDKVAIHYKGSLQDGTVFDESSGGDPLEFTAGGDELIPGMSHGVVGMSVGEKKTLQIPPEQAYGERREELVIRAPKAQLPEGAEVGMTLGLETPGGTMPALLAAIEDDEVVLDANHFLAGKTLVFDIEIVSVDAD